VLPVLTPAEMHEADRRTIAAGTPGELLMERAGRAVARAVREMCGGHYGRRVVVACGPGNNGGDGIVAARVLRGRGVRVEVFQLADGVERAAFTRASERADLAVDAMYGTGFRGALEGDAARVADALAHAGPVLAVDIPSGVDGLTGAVEGAAVRATRTVTFAARKPGLLFEPGRSRAGLVVVADIGIDPGAPTIGIASADDVVRWLPPRAVEAHKWSVGGVMVVGGSGGMSGAPTMVSRAAMRAGAGIVWCGLPGRSAATGASGSEVITIALPATADDALDAAAALDVLKGLERFRALVLGPGLGGDDRTRTAVCRMVAEAPVPLVLDADGLNALQGDLGPLRARRGGLATVVTPHAGEYERLAGRPVGADRLEAARTLAESARCTVLLKGPGTVVAEPGGRVAVNPDDGPWLATAGAGDVLAGIAGALLARGAAAFEAAAAAAWVHSRAADLAGHTGLVAGDLIEAIPAALPPQEG
jgi:ADP-dependent NAD(P)H-hydrate dehydratase / NAD(P)H-hydrate epimerase